MLWVYKIWQVCCLLSGQGTRVINKAVTKSIGKKTSNKLMQVLNIEVISFLIGREGNSQYIFQLHIKIWNKVIWLKYQNTLLQKEIVWCQACSSCKLVVVYKVTSTLGYHMIWFSKLKKEIVESVTKTKYFTEYELIYCKGKVSKKFILCNDQMLSLLYVLFCTNRHWLDDMAWYSMPKHWFHIKPGAGRPMFI